MQHKAKYHRGFLFVSALLDVALLLDSLRASFVKSLGVLHGYKFMILLNNFERVQYIAHARKQD